MSAKKIKTERNWLLALGSIGTVCFTAASLIGCQQAKDKNATSFVPGPIVPPQTPSVPTGGTEVGLPPIAPGIPLPTPTIVIQTPAAAPTIPPIPSPVPLPTIKAETPAPSTPFPPPPPTPFPVEKVSVSPEVVTFDEKTTVGSIQALKLTPSKPPANGSLVLKVESNNPQVVGVSTTAASFVTVVIPPESTDQPKVVLTRLIPATQEGNATITITRDPATTAANYPVGSVNVAVPVTLKKQGEPPTINVDSRSIEFLDSDLIGATKAVTVELKIVPIGGQVVLDIGGTPNPFAPGAPFTVSPPTLIFKEGNKGPQQFGVIRLTDGVFAGSITVKLNTALTTASNFLTGDINLVIPVNSAVGSIEVKYADSVDCTNNLGKIVNVVPQVTTRGKVLPPFTYRVDTPLPSGVTFNTTNGTISIQCPAQASTPPIGSTLSTLVIVTDSSSPPVSGQALVSITVK